MVMDTSQVARQNLPVGSLWDTDGTHVTNMLGPGISITIASLESKPADCVAQIRADAISLASKSGKSTRFRDWKSLADRWMMLDVL